MRSGVCVCVCVCGGGYGEGEGACYCNAIFSIRASAIVRRKKVAEEKGPCKLKGGVIAKDLLPRLTANRNAPTSSLAYDRRSARAPVGCTGRV